MKKNIFKSKLILFFVSFLATQSSMAQISEGGLPYSFKVQLEQNEVEALVIDAPDLSKELEEMSQGIGRNRAAKHININLSPDNAGHWTDLPNGDRLWRLKIHSPSARALYVIYEAFELDKGAKLFLYGDKREELLGAFTSQNNSDGGDFITSYTRGSTTTLELFEPADANSKIAIKQLGYMYNMMPNLIRQDREKAEKYNGGGQGFGDAASCLTNINCPEGDNWQDEKKSVVRIGLVFANSSSWCTGTLMNNTNFDQTPYILTAYHCQEGSSFTGPFNTALTTFYFNYEASGCVNPPSPPVIQSRVGATERTKWEDSDYALYELFNDVPASFSPYFAGWDRRNISPNTGVAIHHSAGDIKKISVENGGGGGIIPAQNVQTTFPFGSGVNYQGIHYWYLRFDDGFTQGGASGGAFFDQDKRVVGQLLGGAQSTCSSTGYDLYGRISSSWTNGSGGGLKPWLDPNAGAGVGELFIDGFDGTISFETNARVVSASTNVSPCLFTDETEVRIIIQNFGQNPISDIPIEYELLDAADNIIASGSTVLMTTLTSTQTTEYSIFVDMEEAGEYRLIAATNLSGDEDPTDDEKEIILSNIKPTIAPSDVQITGADQNKGFTVSWTKGNGESTMVLVKEGSDFTESDLPSDEFSYISSSIYGLGSTVGSAIVVYKGQENSVEVSNLDIGKEYYVAVVTYSCVPEDYLVETVAFSFETVTRLEENLRSEIDLYPNPASEYFNIDFNNLGFEKANLSIYTMTGKKIREINLEESNKICEIDTRSLESGMYLIQIDIDNQGSIRKKFIKE